MAVRTKAAFEPPSAGLRWKSRSIERYEKVANDPDATLRQLKRFAGVQSRNLTNTAVNAFQRYFSEIIQAVALKRPEILKSNEMVRIDEVLRFNRYSDLVSFLIDKKVNELSYGGIKGIEAYFREKCGIEMFANDRSRELLTVFVELRNINVHSGGIVNDIFLRKVGKVDGFQFVRGKRYHVDMDGLALLTDNAMRTTLAIDQAVATKFGIRRKAHKLWIDPVSKPKDQ